MSKKRNNKKTDKEPNGLDSFKVTSSKLDPQIHQLPSASHDDNSSEESPTIDDSASVIDNSPDINGSNDLDKILDHLNNLGIVPDSDDSPDISDLNDLPNISDSDDLPDIDGSNDLPDSDGSNDLPDIDGSNDLDNKSNNINHLNSLRAQIRSSILKNAIKQSTNQGKHNNINPTNQLSDPDKYHMSVYDDSLYAKLSKRTNAAQENASSNYSRGYYIVDQYLTPRLFERAKEGFDYYTINLVDLRNYLQERYVKVYKSPANHLYDYIDSIELVKHFAKMKHLSIVGNIDVSDINVDYLIITWRH